MAWLQIQRLEPQRMSGMSVASSIDRPISDVPSHLGPNTGSQHAYSHSSGSEEVCCPSSELFQMDSHISRFWNAAHDLKPPTACFNGAARQGSTSRPVALTLEVGPEAQLLLQSDYNPVEEPSWNSAASFAINALQSGASWLSPLGSGAPAVSPSRGASQREQSEVHLLILARHIQQCLVSVTSQ